VNAARLPEVFDFEGLVVRCFPAKCATEFAHLPQAERRATPAIVRRLFSTAARYAVEDTACLICGAPAPITDRVLIAVETDGNHDIGCVCAACATWGLPSADGRA
jgi:hypothetical protein